MSVAGPSTVCYVVSTLARCGPTAQLLNLVRHLDPARFRPLVVTLSPEGPASSREEFVRAGVPLASLGLNRLEGLIRAKGVLRRVLEANGRPAIVHSSGIRADTLTNVAAGAITVSTVRNFPQIDYAMAYGRWAGSWMARRQVSALKGKSAVIGVSAAVSDNLRSLGIDNAAVIRNGVDASAFTPASAAEKTGLRSRLGLPSDATVLVTSGDLSTRKDPDFLLAVFRRLYGVDVGHHLVFLGTGPREMALRQMSQGMSNVHFRGQVEDVADHLRAADIYVSASTAEGLPNAVLEALASGLPAVLSDIPPHQELARLALHSVALFKRGDVEGFARGLSMVKADGAQALLPGELSAKTMSESYQALYARLLAA